MVANYIRGGFGIHLYSIYVMKMPIYYDNNVSSTDGSSNKRVANSQPCAFFKKNRSKNSRETIIYRTMPCLLDLGKDGSWILIRLGIS